MNQTSYIIYARRSSDSDDKQALSISSQIDELRKLAVERGIEIDSAYQEEASAREPGRPVFGELMKRVEAGEVSGILCWRLDRLARNMVDGGEIIYLLSKGRLKEIVTPEATYTGTPDSKFMLAMLFGAAAKYTDDLSSREVQRSRVAVNPDLATEGSHRSSTSGPLNVSGTGREPQRRSNTPLRSSLMCISCSITKMRSFSARL
jgi:DNA invertase Pin-like site-specific DNA recombinase